MARLSFLFITILCLIFPITLAATVQWTGQAGNQLWAFAGNWANNQVPTANDDVIINALGGSSVSVSQPAVANSITIAGGSYSQALTLLSQLTVGTGGIKVLNGGTLQVQSNNDLPLKSSGNVIINLGATLVFQSGAITGSFMVYGVLTFSQSALKLLSAATLVNNGSCTIQSSTIQFASGSVFTNNANATAIGGVTFLRNPSDTSNNMFVNNGMFNYQGNSDSDVLNIQSPATFNTALTITKGSVTLNDQFTSSSTISIPSASTLTIGAGTTTKKLNVLKGTGILMVQGILQVTASVSLNILEISDSGTLTLQSASAFTSGLIGGVLSNGGQTSFSNLTLAGGTSTGTGSVTVTNYLSIGVSDTGNTNNFLSAPLTLYGTGQSTTAVYLLLGQGGQFHVAQGATFNIVNSFNIGIQAGKSLIIVDGTLGVTLTGTQTFTSNVDFSGSGTLKVNGGTLVFNGDTVTLGTLFLAVGGFANFQTVALTVGTVSGTGGFNLTAAPQPVSTITTVAVSTVGIVNGNVNVGTFAVNTFNLWSGTVTLASSSTNTVSNLNVAGGTLAGTAKVTAQATMLNLVYPFTLNGVVIKTKTFSVQSQGTGNIQFTNGAAIVADSSMVTRSAVSIN